MKTLILLTTDFKVSKHWKESLQDEVNLTIANEISSISSVLENSDEKIVIVDYDIYINQIEELYKLSRELMFDMAFISRNPSYIKGVQALPYGIKAYGNAMMSKANIILLAETVSLGQAWLYPEFIQEMIKNISSDKKIADQQIHLNKLTRREQEISLLVSEGRTNKEIAQKTGTAEQTVKTHIRAIFDKLSVSDRLSLALLFK